MITIENYEEYFLDYCEGHLNDTQRNEVHKFLGVHPELRAELEDFLGSPILSDDDTEVVVPSELADSLRHTSDYDEADVPYFDRLAVLNLEKIATPAEQLEYGRMKYESEECSRIAKIYSKTVLTPEEIEYPDKRRLMIFPIWRKIVPYAAAAAVAGLAVLFSVTFDGESINILSPASPVAVHSGRPAADNVAASQPETIGGPASQTTQTPSHRQTSRRESVAQTSNAASYGDEMTQAQELVADVPTQVNVEIEEQPALNFETEDLAPIQIAAADYNNQEDTASVDVELLPFDDINDEYFESYFADNNNTKQHRHRRKFLFSCGKALKFITRRFLPNVRFDMDRNADGKISRVAMYAQNKVYALERKE